MIKVSIFLFSIFFSTTIFSQNINLPYNKVSIETSLGYSTPMSNKSFSGGGSYASSPHLNFGIRYTFNKMWGIKGAFNYDSFEEGTKGTTHHRFNLESYYNIGELIDLSFMSNHSVALYSHLGGGVTYNHTRIKEVTIGFVPGWERQIDLTFGISPRFRLNDTVSLITDWTYIMAMKQHFYYSGEAILSAGSNGINGSHMTVSLGISFSIGDYDEHIDFY